MLPTGAVRLPELALYTAAAERQISESPHQNFVWVPALATYSHSASERRRYVWPVFALSFLVNSFALFHLTSSTGLRSPLTLLGLFPITARHSDCVISYLPTANGYRMSTRRTGFSLSRPSVDPISNDPCGITTISGHSAQSRKVVPGRKNTPTAGVV